MNFMKKLFMSLIVAAILPNIAYAGDYGYQQPFLNITGSNQIDGVSINPNTAAPINLASGVTSYDAHYSPFGNSLLANPLQQSTFASFLTASANAGTAVVLASSSGRTIFPGGGLTIMVSGTASGATSLNLECQSSHRVFVTWPIAQLVNNVPVGIYASSTTVLGSALTTGCTAGDAVIISANGTLGTTSQIFINLPYTVQ